MFRPGVCHYKAHDNSIRERKCAFNVTLRRVLEIIVAVEKEQVVDIRSCIFSVNNPACKAHAPCYVVSGPSGYSVFFHIFHKWHDFLDKVIEHKICVFIFSASFISHFKKNSARYYHECITVFTSRARCSCHSLIKLEISRQFFEEKKAEV